jgi:hypothetical protein
MKPTYEQLVETIKELEKQLDKANLRAELLQKDLDAIDDFHALTESEVARSLRNTKVN